MKTFGQSLKEARIDKGLTQKQLAELIGAKHNSVSNWEKDQNKPDVDTVSLICRVLNIPASCLLKAEPPKTNLRSIARLEDNNVSEDEDKIISDFITLIINQRRKNDSKD